MSHGRSHALPLPSTRLRACAHAPQAGRAVAPRPPPLVRLGDVCEIVSGSTPKTSVESYWGGSFPWITPAELNDKTVVVGDTTRHLSEEGVASAALKPFPAGTVLLSSRAPIGKVAIAGCDMYCNQGFKNLICSDAIHNFYLYYWLKSHTSFLNSLGRGATFKEISKAIVAQIQIPLPPLPEQKRIAAILDKICEMKRNAEARLQKLDLLVKARFVEMFGDVPNSVTMADICLIITDGTHLAPKFVETGIPFLFVSNIATNKVTYDTEKFIDERTYSELIKRTPIEIGDVLLSTVGSYGHPAVVNSTNRFLFQRHIAYLKPCKKIIDSQFLHGAILSANVQEQIERKVKGIAQKTLNLSEVKTIKLPLPPLALQRQFAAFVEKVEGLKATAKKELEQVDLLYRAKLQEFFG